VDPDYWVPDDRGTAVLIALINGLASRRWENDINDFKRCGFVAILVPECTCNVTLWRVRVTVECCH
jgi:citrate lyase beta subunit